MVRQSLKNMSTSQQAALSKRYILFDASPDTSEESLRLSLDPQRARDLAGEHLDLLRKLIEVVRVLLRGIQVHRDRLVAQRVRAIMQSVSQISPQSTRTHTSRNFPSIIFFCSTEISWDCDSGIRISANPTA